MTSSSVLLVNAGSGGPGLGGGICQLLSASEPPWESIHCYEALPIRTLRRQNLLSLGLYKLCLDRQVGVSSSILGAGVPESMCFPLWCHHIPKAQKGENAAVRGLVELSEERDMIC